MTIPAKTRTITGKGWFVFCPVWLPQGWQDSGSLELIPRFVPQFVLDCAMFVQQVMNFFISQFAPECCGFLAFAWEIEPFELNV